MTQKQKSPTDQSKGYSKNSNSHYTTETEIVLSFKQAQFDVGIGTDESIYADGIMRPYTALNDKPNSKKCWYVLYKNNGFYVGVFGDHRVEGYHKWHSRFSKPLSPYEHYQISQHIQRARQVYKQQQNKRRARARIFAEIVWNKSIDATRHAYLSHKRVKPYGVKLSGDRLVIPLRDVSGVLHSLQFINPNGSKILLTGGAKRGCFHLLGIQPKQVLFMAEGYSTAATIFEATKLPTIMAVDAHNLLPVAKELRLALPQCRFIFTADDDYKLDSKINTGISAAIKAAKAVGGDVIIPHYQDGIRRKADFNDVMKADGMAWVKEQLQSLKV